MDRTECDTEDDQVARALAEPVRDIAHTPQELAFRLAELKSRSAGSSPASTEDEQDRLARVLRAAREVFGERGYGAPMEDVARRARVGAGSVYRRFPTKDALVRRVALEETALLAEQAREALAWEHEPGKALARFVRVAVESGSGRLVHPDAMVDPSSEEPAVVVLTQYTEELLNEARAAGEVRVDITVQHVLALIGSSPPAHPEPSVRAASCARFLDIMLTGLRDEQRSARTVSDQLSAALRRRVPIEQAKGHLAERFGIDDGQAFDLLRRHARRHRRKLSDVASEVIEGTSDIESLSGPRPERH
ncbi:ANTAR domain-containing protein [Streptomyces longisporoflavus]|uniref:ANTAR domain-containing protein n=1 Tax=Streptomyces longisporoflavus TaxID=28044 RepID=A0ABW7QSJ4_9ACTN